MLKARNWWRRHATMAVTASAALIGFSSCKNETQTPRLNVKSVTTWHVPPIKSRLPGPRSLAVAQDDDVVVLDNAGRVLVYDSTGKVTRDWEMPEFDVGRPEGAVVLHDGRIVVCDTHYHRVVIFDAEGTVLGMFGSYGTEPGSFIYPVAVAVDSSNQLYVGEYGGNDRIQVFTTDGAFVRQFGGFGTDPGEFQRPSGIVWHQGEVLVADAINNRVQKFTDHGEFVAIVTGPDTGLRFPYDLAMAPDGNIYIVEYGAGRITLLSPQGAVLGQFGSTGRGPEQLVTPWGIVADSRGRLRVADTGNRRIIAIEPSND